MIYFIFNFLVAVLVDLMGFRLPSLSFYKTVVSAKIYYFLVDIAFHFTELSSISYFFSAAVMIYPG